MTELPDTDKIEAAGLYLFTDWDDLPGSVRCGARDLLGYVMAWSRRLAAAEQAVERLTRERDALKAEVERLRLWTDQTITDRERALKYERDAAEAVLTRTREALERLTAAAKAYWDGDDEDGDRLLEAIHQTRAGEDQP